VHVPEEHASVVQGFPSSHEPEQLPPREPNPSWQVTVAPEFMTTWAAASAPVNFDVLTVTSAFVAMKSAWSCAFEFSEMPEDESKYITRDLAVRPEPDAGPANDPLLKLPPPVTESVVAAVTTSVPLLFSVSDEKT
jgi:hypothetical protein